jgi:hypothetical protein
MRAVQQKACRTPQTVIRASLMYVCTRELPKEGAHARECTKQATTRARAKRHLSQVSGRNPS